MAQKSIDAGDFTKPFYDLCANGDIIGAYNWLNAYTGEFDMREQWLNLLSIYAPYCNTWELYQGDPTLIAQTVGLSVKCTGFTSKVMIGGYDRAAGHHARRCGGSRDRAGSVHRLDRVYEQL